LTFTAFTLTIFNVLNI